jgi:hypothetical protein
MANDFIKLNDELTHLLEISNDVKEEAKLAKPKLIDINNKLEFIKQEIVICKNTGDLEDGEFIQQKGEVINTIKLEIETNKLLMVKIDTILKED